ncbi:hypothetical protein FIBSPDRAFT_853237, partial [Athelia psychrophila]
MRPPSDIHCTVSRSGGISKGLMLGRRSLRVLTLDTHPPLLGSEGLGTDEEPSDYIFAAQSPPFRR